MVFADAIAGCYMEDEIPNRELMEVTQAKIPRGDTEVNEAAPIWRARWRVARR